jgi:SagB-type dehydrogenase family enzyme
MDARRDLPCRGEAMESITHYHDLTSYDRIKMRGGYLDWSNQPEPYKIYEECERIPLPREISLPSQDLWEVMEAKAEPEGVLPWDMGTIARILVLTCSVTARAKYSAGEFHYRSTPSAGALYPTEIYLCTTGQGPIPPGLYFYDLASHSLSLLRLFTKEEEARRILFFITGRFFRSAWKYSDRGYRYVLLDAGHLLENLHLALNSMKLAHSIRYDFPDKEVNEFLGLDPGKEVALVIVELGAQVGGRFRLPEGSRLAEKIPRAREICLREEVPPLVIRAHELTSSLKGTIGEGADMWERLGLQVRGQRWLKGFSSRPKGPKYADVLWSRRSRRAYLPRELGQEALEAMARGLEIRDEPSEFHPRKVIAIGASISRVQGLEPGFYLMGKAQGSLSLVLEGDLSPQMARACLEQEWIAGSAVQFLFMANLRHMEETFGPRSYRYAMLLSGRVGQRIYLGATALGLGACGIGAFYDEEARRLLGLNEDSRLLYLVTLGPIRGKAS